MATTVTVSERARPSVAGPARRPAAERPPAARRRRTVPNWGSDSSIVDSGSDGVEHEHGHRGAAGEVGMPTMSAIVRKERPAAGTTGPGGRRPAAWCGVLRAVGGTAPHGEQRHEGHDPQRRRAVNASARRRRRPGHPRWAARRTPGRRTRPRRGARWPARAAAGHDGRQDRLGRRVVEHLGHADPDGGDVEQRRWSRRRPPSPRPGRRRTRRAPCWRPPSRAGGRAGRRARRRGARRAATAASAPAQAGDQRG